MKSYSRDSLTRITITLPASLLEDIDRLAGRRGRSRYVAEAAIQRIRRDRTIAALDASHGALAGDADLESAEGVDRWIDRARSDPAE